MVIRPHLSIRIPQKRRPPNPHILPRFLRDLIDVQIRIRRLRDIRIRMSQQQSCRMRSQLRHRAASRGLVSVAIDLNQRTASAVVAIHYSDGALSRFTALWKSAAAAKPLDGFSELAVGLDEGFSTLGFRLPGSAAKVVDERGCDLRHAGTPIPE